MTVDRFLKTTIFKGICEIIVRTDRDYYYSQKGFNIFLNEEIKRVYKEEKNSGITNMIIEIER